MNGRKGGVPACIAIALVLIAISLLPACGRKAKPQPLWGKTAASQARFGMR